MGLASALCSFCLLLHPMVLEFAFSNGEFQIRHARVAVFRVDAVADIKTLPRKTKEHLYRNEESVRKYLGSDEGEISDGFWGFTPSLPGVYRAMLAEIVIVRSSDQKEFTVPLYTAMDFKIAENDLQAGRYKIVITEPLFRIIVLDQNGQRVADKIVAFMDDEMTFQLRTDGNGEIAFLGDPSKYTPEVPDEPWLSIRTEPLPQS